MDFLGHFVYLVVLGLGFLMYRFLLSYELPKRRTSKPACPDDTKSEQVGESASLIGVERDGSDGGGCIDSPTDGRRVIDGTFSRLG